MNEEKENQFKIEFVGVSTDKVMSDGADVDLVQPAVYFKIKKEHEVVCNYCNKKFIKKN